MFASLSQEVADACAICTSPSKTFNLAALHNANVFIANPQARKAFQRELDAEGFSQPNIMGLVACQAAYRHGADGLDQLVEYLADNIALMEETFRRKMPRLRLVKPQGTYLPWVDLSGLGLPPVNWTDASSKRQDSGWTMAQSSGHPAQASSASTSPSHALPPAGAPAMGGSPAVKAPPQGTA